MRRVWKRLRGLLVSVQLRFHNSEAEALWREYETQECSKIDPLAWLVLLLAWMAGVSFCYHHYPIILRQPRFWAPPATYLLLLSWSSLRRDEYLAHRRKLILSARLIYSRSTFLPLLKMLPAEPQTGGTWLLFKAVMLAGGLPSSMVYGNFLRIEFLTHAIVQLLNLARFIWEAWDVCGCALLQHGGLGAWLEQLEAVLSSAAGFLPRGGGALGGSGRRTPSNQDRCFAFFVSELLVLSWAMPVCVTYLLDRSSRRRWLKRLAAGDPEVLPRRAREERQSPEPQERPLGLQAVWHRVAQGAPLAAAVPYPVPAAPLPQPTAPAAEGQGGGGDRDGSGRQGVAVSEEFRRLTTASERAYWGSYDLHASNFAFVLLALPLTVMVWRGALALAAWRWP